MVRLRDVRRLALSFPGACEKGHHGMPSFRVADKIFATVPDDTHLHAMVGPDEAEMAVRAAPGAFEELWWGKKQAGVRVHLAEADIDLLTVVLTEAWRRKAPRRLASAGVSPGARTARQPRR